MKTPAIIGKRWVRNRVQSNRQALNTLCACGHAYYQHDHARKGNPFPCSGNHGVRPEGDTILCTCDGYTPPAPAAGRGEGGE